MGAAWRETRSVYGPVFTLASEPVAAVAGSSADAAAWLFKGLAATATLAAALLAARLSRRPLLAAAFVGWNPLLAIHGAGGGHNDALVGALLLAALALEGARRTRLAGLVWAASILVKWVPLPLLALRLASPAVERRARLAGAAAISLVALAALATLRYGTSWLGAAAPLAENALRRTSYALPSRLEQLGVPEDVALGLALAALAVGSALLLRTARRGRPRLAAAGCLLLVTTPYLAVWYLGWAVPLAAADDDDRLARAGCLALGAYLLPQTIPL
jgi:alpha-1,6-mannosyltransferase